MRGLARRHSSRPSTLIEADRVFMQDDEDVIKQPSFGSSMLPSYQRGDQLSRLPVVANLSRRFRGSFYQCVGIGRTGASPTTHVRRPVIVNAIRFTSCRLQTGRVNLLASRRNAAIRCYVLGKAGALWPKNTKALVRWFTPSDHRHCGWRQECPPLRFEGSENRVCNTGDCLVLRLRTDFSTSVFGEEFHHA